MPRHAIAMVSSARSAAGPPTPLRAERLARPSFRASLRHTRALVALGYRAGQRLTGAEIAVVAGDAGQLFANVVVVVGTMLAVDDDEVAPGDDVDVVVLVEVDV